MRIGHSRSARGVVACALVLGLLACTGDGEGERVILATTTSTQDSGLLDVLIPAFEDATGFAVQTIAVGSGQAIELGRRGEADVVLAHAPDAEEDLVAAGVTGGRTLVMYNDFVVVGPPEDPAGVGTAEDINTVMRSVAAAGAPFVSRGDDSGTHALELRLWAGAGIDPRGDWYRETGQGMGSTLQIAAETRAYTLSDRGTYLSATTNEPLEVLFDDDPELLNIYHVIPITTQAGDRVNQPGGQAFADWVLDAEAQEIIGAFGIEDYGQPLFVPAAGLQDDLIGLAG